MGMCMVRESGVGTLCCRQKAADARGSRNSGIQPREWRTVLVPDTLILFTQVLRPSGEVLWLSH